MQYIFLIACCTLSYSDVSLPVAFLRYVGSDDLIFSFVLALSPSSGIVCTGSGSYGSDVGVLSSCNNYSIPGTKSFLFKLCNIFVISAGSVFSHSAYLISLLMMTLLFLDCTTCMCLLYGF